MNAKSPKQAAVQKPPKTPWNPSRRATARVSNPLPVPTACHLCDGSVTIVGHKDIYGRDYSEWPYAYRCTRCLAYVGIHPFTNIPLGTLADEDLRSARKHAKDPFEKLWRSAKYSRTEAYTKLSEHLSIPVEECHFGWFDEQTCWMAYEWAVEEQKTLGIYSRTVTEE